VAKIKALTEQKQFAVKDPYGVPVLDYQSAIRGQCEIGLGPLHTAFDDKGFAYTSVFIETVVAKWSLKDLKVVEKISAHYNIGHLSVPGGDTVHPDGKYLVMMNKWSLDRFNKVGPLAPQNFQLVDLQSDKMTLLYDMAIPLGEPHNAQMIRADRIKPEEIYSPTGLDPLTDAHSPFAVEGGKERIERKGKDVDVYMSAIRSHFTPDIIRVKEGDTTVIGGIYVRRGSTNEAGVPWLMKIPIIGFFFKTSTVSENRQELLIFITPRIVTQAAAVRPVASASAPAGGAQ